MDVTDMAEKIVIGTLAGVCGGGRCMIGSSAPASPNAAAAVSAGSPGSWRRSARDQRAAALRAAGLASVSPSGNARVTAAVRLDTCSLA